MAGIFGLINMSDVSLDQVYVNTLGQSIVYDATQRYLAAAEAQRIATRTAFVERQTTGYSERYKLPGGGRLQRRGGQAQSGAVKAGGSYDVSFPLEDFGAQIAATDVAMAYMTAAQYQLHVDTVLIQAANTYRFALLKRLFNNVASTFIDETLTTPTLTIQPLANGDTVVYPPVIGSESEATEDHYLESGYVVASISNTNNPVPTVVAELEQHFGEMTGGTSVAFFANSDVIDKLETLTSFTSVEDNYIRSGANADIPINLPSVPGTVRGRMNGAWIIQWRWIPTGWAFGMELDAPPPLVERVDPPSTGLGQGVQLVATNSEFPIESAHWRFRFGLGAGNRLNGVALEFGTGGTYTIPTAYQ